MRIKYIGGKSVKADNIAGTGLTWAAGQVIEVENPEACRKLLVHSGVWALESILSDDARAATIAALERQDAERLEAEEQREREEADRAADALAQKETAAAERAQAEADAAAAQPATTPTAAAPAGLAGAKVPGSMSLDELMAFCKAKGVKFHPNIKRETLLERLVAHAEGAQS